jgi:hypothetical protein
MRPVLTLLFLSVTTAIACGGETVTATNNVLGGAAGAGAVSASGSGGIAGSVTFGGSGGAATECDPGATEVLGVCEKCGSETRTCDENGLWAPSVCDAQGDCNPGDVVGGCPDPCEEQVCGADCKLSACQLEAGAECKWQKGTVPNCCGPDAWQFCSKVTCKYFPCSPCQTGTTCFSAC